MILLLTDELNLHVDNKSGVKTLMLDSHRLTQQANDANDKGGLTLDLVIS